MLQHYGAVARRFRQAIGDRLMSRARARALEKGVPTVQILLEDSDPANTILRRHGVRGEEPTFRFDGHCFVVGEYISITADDGIQRTFRITEVLPVP